jgi:phytanoyl-CoA hydroxylase
MDNELNCSPSLETRPCISAGLGAYQKRYRSDGYVTVRSLIPHDICDAVRGDYELEVKPSAAHIYRMSSARPEKNAFSAAGFLMNPILNIQSVSPSRFPRFRRSGVALLTHQNLYRTVQELLGEVSVLVQTMYFEGNPVTEPHQDAYYLDADDGRMVGAWIALEDIAPGAGRFFVCPGSQKIKPARNRGELNIAYHHDRYQEFVQRCIAEQKLELHAPALKKGDAVFWSSRTIHGSLETSTPDHSRSSCTAHFIARTSKLVQFQARTIRLNLEEANGVLIYRHKDQARLINRLIHGIECAVPTLFSATKRIAIRAFITH